MLISVMVVGSLLMWIGAPLFWLWLGSQLQSGSTPSFGPYLLILVGVVASMIVLGKLLSTLDRVYVLTPYRDWDHRHELQANQGAWPPAFPVAALSAGSKLLLPTAASGLK